MKKENLENELLEFITSNISRELLISIQEAILDGYHLADQSSRNLCLNTSPTRLRSIARKYLIDDRLAGVKKDCKTEVEQTKPKGEQFILIHSGKITFSHIELRQGAKARKAHHRELLSFKNAILEPVNLDLFENTDKPKLTDQLHLTAIVLRPQPHHKDQSKPHEIHIAVPYTDWSNYHFQIPINELLQHYNDQTTTNNNLEADELAWPKLKQKMLNQEQRNA